MKIGSNDVTGARLGSQNVSRIYQGSNVAWEPGAAPPPPSGIYAYEYLQDEYWVQDSYMFTGMDKATIDGVGAFTYTAVDSSHQRFCILSSMTSHLKMDISFDIEFLDGAPGAAFRVATMENSGGTGTAEIFQITTDGHYTATGAPANTYIGFYYGTSEQGGSSPAAGGSRVAVTNLSVRLSQEQDFTWSDTAETVGVSQTVYYCDAEVVTIDGNHVTVEIPAGSLSGTGVHVIEYPSNEYGLGIRTVELNVDLRDFDPTVEFIWRGANTGCILPVKTGRKMAMVYEVNTDGSSVQRNDSYPMDDVTADYNYEWFPATSSPVTTQPV